MWTGDDERTRLQLAAVLRQPRLRAGERAGGGGGADRRLRRARDGGGNARRDDGRQPVRRAPAAGARAQPHRRADQPGDRTCPPTRTPTARADRLQRAAQRPQGAARGDRRDDRRDAGSPTVAEIHRDNMQAIGGRAKELELLRGGAAALRAPADDFDVYVALLDGEVVAGLLVFVLQRHRRVLHARGATTTTAREQPLALSCCRGDGRRRAARAAGAGTGAGRGPRRTACTASSASGAPARAATATYVQLNDESLLDAAPEELRRALRRLLRRAVLRPSIVGRLVMAKVVVFGTGGFAEMRALLPRRTTARTRSSRSPSTATASTSRPSYRGLPVVAVRGARRDAIRRPSTRCSSPSATRRSTASAPAIFERGQGEGLRADHLRQLEGDDVWARHEIGENCFIFEDNTIQPFVKIGDDVVLWSGNHIGHHAEIGDHCFISSHVVISGLRAGRAVLLPRRQLDVPRRHHDRRGRT